MVNAVPVGVNISAKLLLPPLSPPPPPPPPPSSPPVEMETVTLKIGDQTVKFKPAKVCLAVLHLVMLLSLLAISLFAFYAFTYQPPPTSPAAELRLFLRTHPLSLGKDAETGFSEISSVGYSAAAAAANFLVQFMTYTPAAPRPCPDDSPLDQKLLLKATSRGPAAAVQPAKLKNRIFLASRPRYGHR